MYVENLTLGDDYSLDFGKKANDRKCFTVEGTQ